MVCKLNFDYEILLSDESESIYESDISDNETNRCKKFVLGDNILSVNPIEIISVRRLNENISTEKVPMNYYIHYDEALSIFEEESVSETESDIYSDFTTREKEFEYPFKYQLPTVNRFEFDSRPSVNLAENIKEINKYCFNEKSRRIKMGIEKELNTKNDIQIMKKNKSNTKTNDQSTLVKKSQRNMSQDYEKENLISSETLSNLPIDLLTKFINGEKSLYELSQVNNIKKDPRKLKKSKRHKMNKKVNKTTESSAETMEVKTISLITPDSLESTEILQEIHLGSSLNEHILCENIIKNNTQISENKHNENNLQANYNSETSETLKVIQPTKILLDNFKTSNSKSKKNKMVHSDKMFTKQNICQKSEIREKSLDKMNLSDQNLINCSYDAQERVEQSNEQINPSSIESNENNTDLPYQPEFHYGTKLCADCFNLTEDNLIPVLCQHKFFEKQMSIYSTSDECKDNRTSSTDSGFQDVDSNDVSDETHSTITFINKTFINENPTKESELDLKVKLKDRISTETFLSRKTPLNLSSFKFNFINESILSAKEMDGTKPTKYVDYEPTKRNEIQNPETLCKEDEIYPKPDFVNIISNEIITKPERFYDDISFNKLKCADHYDNKNSVTSSKSLSGLHDCELDLTEKVALDESNTSENTLSIQEENVDKDGHRKNYSLYETNYYPFRSDISNKEELSQFLNYQWLRFCEKYTMYNHKLMVL